MSHPSKLPNLGGIAGIPKLGSEVWVVWEPQSWRQGPGEGCLLGDSWSLCWLRIALCQNCLAVCLSFRRTWGEAGLMAPGDKKEHRLWSHPDPGCEPRFECPSQDGKLGATAPLLLPCAQSCETAEWSLHPDHQQLLVTNSPGWALLGADRGGSSYSQLLHSGWEQRKTVA